MGRCGCEMMIKCEVKTGQTVESIENTRREGGDGVEAKMNEKEREVSLLRFENSPDGRETRLLLFNE